ncbi:MAG TPA: phosphate ABC transporter substrate-binding protein [Clostridiales bacterium]|jgi:phosphate transport system substrate-binding protein|nr:phosphate ABC transporter substrate-binding protein [Clostridiales bacterium]HCS11926.1 phosphate ABC transporter substrate-binding protein [Clostridiales bacterium]
MKKSKLLSIITLALMLSMVFAGCTQETPGTPAADFDFDKDITVVARDAASGTRGAFHEIMNIIVKENDTEVDKLVVGALEFDGTDKVITAIEGDKYGIGYISLGSVSERIKAVAVDGVEPTVENVRSGSYSVSRPFLLVTKGTESKLVKDFLKFTESAEGQAITNEMKFIGAIDAPGEYTASGMSGTIKVAGSTSVAPLMEKLQEAYNELNPDVTFETQAQGSSQGIKAAIDGSYDIGMASRELKAEEASELNRYVLAIDGIAVIVNNENPKSDLAADDITNIYIGEITKWNEVK